MNAHRRILLALETAIARGDAPGAPPGLGRAVRHAIFPGGARIRPQLTIAVSMACGEDDPGLADAAAAAIELLHCASLVHDDLPCFDDAPVRRGLPSVHVAFGERLAVLVGDALIVASRVTAVRAGVDIQQSVSRNAQMLAEADVVVAFVAPNGRARRQPAAWVDRFRSLVA